LLLANIEETDLLCESCISELPQFGFQDPLEAICYFNDTNQTVSGKLAIRRFDGAHRRVELFVLGPPGQVTEYNVPGGSVFGHPGIPGVLAIGAIDASDPNHDDIEPFSSHGPARIDFPTVQIRSKPDLIAIDGVSVTGAGGFPNIFFGTSAASPHVAGVAALLKQAAPGATPQSIRAALMGGAVDLGSLGADSVFGSGRVDALSAYNVLVPDADNDGITNSIDNCPQDANTDQTDTDTDGDGNACDLDDDNDGVLDAQDALPLNSNESVDTDGDGIGNNADSDDDNDGIPDSFESANGLDPLNAGDAAQDADGDGFTNLREFRAGTDLHDANSKPPASMPWLPLLLDE
jgi:subtilisin family serine protease